MPATSVMVRRCSAYLLMLASLIALLWPVPASTQGPSKESGPSAKSVPPELAPWIDWVREVEPPPGNCRMHDETLICIWPTQASIVVDDESGSFELSLTASEAGVVDLIGDDNTWPQDVRVDGKPALVIDSGGTPQVSVSAGAHRVQGRFIWRERPDELSLPPEVALVELIVDGVGITFPIRTDDLLDIPEPRIEPEDDVEDEPEDEPEDEGEGEDEGEDEPAEPEPDSERVEVSRLISDNVPLEITTRVDLRISGQTREVILPYPLWPEAKLVRIDSDLPLSLDENKQLVIKASAGTHSITLSAQLPRSPTELAPPPLTSPWPGEEVWVWATHETVGGPSMGQVVVTGGRPVDRTRTHVPGDWPEGATYSVDAGTPLHFEVLQRGVAESAPNELALERVAVFDLSGDGWYMLDQVKGTMNSSSRLDLQTGELGGQLGSVLVDGRPQVITVNGQGQPGVELRNPRVELLAQWRQAGDARTIPLAGWSETFESAHVEFKLPRGWDLLHISGPGRTSTTWLQHWDPLNAILLLGVCIAIGLWVDRKAAVAALIGLGLLFNATDDGFIPTLVLLAALVGVHHGLQRRRSKLATRSLRATWLLGMLLLLSWVVFVLPEDLEQVWRSGAPALGRVRIEGADELFSGVFAFALALTALLAGVAFVIEKVGGRAPKLVIPGAVLLGVLGFGMISMMTLGSRGDMSPTAANVQMEEAPPPEEEYRQDDEAGGRGMRHKADEKEEEAFDPDMAARNAGVLGVMEQESGHFLASPYGGAYAVGNDDSDVWGGLTGSEVGEAYGVGGLGLVGTGRGGGGTGEGTIGLGNTGLIGKGGGGGTGSGYGRGSGAGFGGRGAAVPQVRQAKATVDGSLDKDIIRRIVRAHINEIRACYNAGLSKNPALGGRVEIQFAIAGTGSVTSSVVKETTLADSSVSQCIAKAIKRWQFPKPPGGGNVTVSYPFMLDNGDGSNDGGDVASSEEPTRYLSSEELPDAPPPEIPQTGEAKPDWDGRVWTVEVERAVKQGEQLELVLLSPTANKLISLLRALALAAAALLLLIAGWSRLLTGPIPLDEDDDLDLDDAGSSMRAGAGAVVVLLVLLAPGLAWAAPPKELLDELSDRVNQDRELAPSPDCGDECALIPKLEVKVEGQTLTIEAEVHMEGPGVLTLPGPLSVWAPSSISVDGKPAPAVIAVDNRLLVRMDEGLHRVVARGPIAGASLNLSLVVPPKRVEVTAKGWQVTGLDERDTATNLEFVRDASDEPEDDGLGDLGEVDEFSEADDPVTEQVRDDSKTSQDLPTWLLVEREIEIGPRWSMRTTVTRINVGDASVKVQVPLLEGEQMIESSRKLEDPKATLTLERAGDSITWTSVLDTREKIVLTAPKDGQWTERWTFVCGAAWQCDASGVPPSSRSGARSVYHPWPGESLEVALFKPAPADGPRLSIDNADLLVQLGEDGTTAILSATVRTSTVGERTITIPEDAQIQSVRVDGKEIPINKDSAAIRLTFQPGTHPLRIEWKQDAGWSSSYETPAVSLGGAAVNAEVHIEFTDDSDPVLLRTSGTGQGPFVWFWVWLLALAGVALLLHRFNHERKAIKLHDWFLLALGFPTVVLPIVLGWFVLVAQRKRLVALATSDRRYNMVQLGIALLTLVTTLIALNAARLLLTDTISTMPENLHGSELLRWYSDHTDDAMPQGKVLSVPASLWRVLGVAWVGWFGWRAIAWFKWCRAELGDGGWLRWPPPAPAMSDEPFEQLEAGNTSNTSNTSNASNVAADLPRVTQLERDETPTPSDGPQL